MTDKRMRLVLQTPSDTGMTPTQGAKLITPGGEEIPCIASIQIGIEPSSIVKATVVLNSVVVEYAPRLASLPPLVGEEWPAK